MTRELTLKPRNPGLDGKPTWHDAYVLLQALRSIAENKPMAKAAMWGVIAAKVQLEVEHENLRKNISTEIIVELRNKEVGVLWKELLKLQSQQFGQNAMGQPASPSLGTLWLMLEDFAKQLDEELPEISDNDDEI